MFDNNNIKSIREQANLTQDEMAKKLGVKRSTYSMWESNNECIPIKRLIKLVNLFNLSIDYVFNFTSQKQYPNCKEINIKESGKRLKEFRKNLNLTQIELGEILKIAPTMVLEYEKGRYIISTGTLYLLCKKYHISADYLLGRIDKNTLK